MDEGGGNLMFTVALSTWCALREMFRLARGVLWFS